MKISFVIPTYNSVAFLPIAVKSACDQTHKDIEVVIVDDKSTDHTWQYLEWLESQKDERIKIHRLEKNVGRAKARNYGNSVATGDIICVLDADDAATPNRAELTIKKFQASGADYIYGPYMMIDAVGNDLGTVGAEVFSREKAKTDLINRIGHSTAAYTKEIAEDFPYSTDPIISKLGIDDWEHQIRIAEAGKRFDFVPQRLAVYRVSEGGVSATRNSADVFAFKKAYVEALKVPA